MPLVATEMFNLLYFTIGTVIFIAFLFYLFSLLTVSFVCPCVGPAAADDDADVVIKVKFVADVFGVPTPEGQAIEVLLPEKLVIVLIWNRSSECGSYLGNGRGS